MPHQPARLFQWVGGSPALDFVNTVTWSGSERPNERLQSYADLIRWTREAGLAEAGELRTLAWRAGARPKEADLVQARALEFREALHGLLSAQAAGVDPDDAFLETVNRVLGEALARLRLGGGGESGWSWDWSEQEELERPLWRIAWATAQLLTSDERKLVRRCAADGCGWVFLDRSRNHARRWCDMKVCGNSEKARRFYRRKTGKPGA